MVDASSRVLSAQSSLRLYLLGSFRVERGALTIHFPTRKIESLLAYLALHLEQHPREKLAALLWGDSTDEQARHSLRTALATLRKELGDDILLADRETVQLNPDHLVWVDALQFEQAAVDDPQSAIALHQGDLLPDFYDDWILPERERLHALYLDMLLRLAQDARSQSQYARAIEFAQKVLATDPANEKAYQHIIFCLAATGNRVGALKQYEECANKLRDELGVEPSSETTALRDQIMQELTGAKAPEALLTNLPIPLTSFVGRQSEMTEVKRLLDPSGLGDPKGLGARLLTLTGAGGCGKTRLAIQVARELVETFPNGAWWVDFAPLSDASLVPQAVAQSLGVREVPNQSLEETLVNFLRARHLLLVLDNCEHLIAACAQLADKLLSACAGLKILVTSREALGIAGEIAWRVPSLALPDAVHLPPLDQLTRYDSIQLFAQRATAVLPNWKLNGNASTVAHICVRLDGIPLAIELAAARMKVLSVEQIAARLDDRFTLLTGGSRTALPRHQTLRATIDWSYDLLADEERALLRRLSVFAGGWPLEAAEDVCGSKGADDYPSTLDLLSRLVDKSLVIVEERDGAARHRLLETIRQYAHEKLLESGEAEHLRDRHLDFFLRLAEKAKPRLRGPEQLMWLHQLEVEHENLRVALQWSFESSQSMIALRLADALFWFWLLRVHMNEGLARLGSILLLPETTGRTLARAKALCTAGHLYWAQANYAQARPLEEEALAIGRELDDKWSIATALHFLGPVIHRLGDPTRAQALLEEGLMLWRQLGDAEGVTLSLTFLGDVVLDQGDYSRAQTLYEEAAILQRQIQDTLFLGYTLRRLAQLALDRGDHENATILCTESLNLNRAARNNRGIAACLVGLAGVAAITGQLLRAAKLLGTVQALLDSIRARLLHADLVQHERTLASVRAALARERFTAAWLEGRALTPEQAVEYALEQNTT